MDILEKKLDDMNKVFEAKFEGLVELIKQEVSKQGRPDVNEVVASADGNNRDVNNSSAAENKYEMFENKLSHVNDDLVSIKETLANINIKLESNKNDVQTNNNNTPSYASAMTSRPAVIQGQGQGGGRSHGGLHRQAAGRYENRDEDFLNRLRQDKAKFMIVFGIVEEEFEGVCDMDQKCVDQHTIGEILEDMKQKDLIKRVVTTQRLGSKSDGRIRPIRVEFDSVMSRDTACRNARELKNSTRYKNVASIARDKTREDREKDKAIYLANKHQRSLTGPGSIGAPSGSSTPTAAEIENRRRAEENERDLPHPQVVPERVQP